MIGFQRNISTMESLTYIILYCMTVTVKQSISFISPHSGEMEELVNKPTPTVDTELDYIPYYA